ncbi:tetratricopeptide repeat-containing sensor histidine kinase [Chitinophaga agri]|uniref:histidine kinase n=1 Tax=Chitinophaga agri TaxID=2703787 RepID=A0A6B9ZDZ2_9BACT|nr:histidine kinase dimerization/phosphoacceptor domain -containing protein [Chitinophaga agri]QHS59711.1 tetratricopeptide repeat protein [Chitinophaga agri]
MRASTASRLIFISFLIFICSASRLNAQQDAVVNDLLRELKKTGEDSTRAAVLRQLAGYYVNRPGEAAGDLNAAILYANDALTISSRSKSVNGMISSLVLLSQITRELKNTDKAKAYIDQALAQVPKTNQAVVIADAYLEKSTQFQIDPEADLKEKTHYYGLYLDLLTKISPGTLKLADALKYYGDLLNYGRNPLKAMRFLKQSLALYQQLHYERLQDIYHLIGATASRLGNTREAIVHLLSAMKIAEKYHDTTLVAFNIYHDLATSYSALKNPAQFCYYLEKAMYIARKIDLELELFAAAELSVGYTSLGRYREALTLLEKAIKRCPESNRDLLAILKTRLCGTYTQQHSYDQAQRLFHEASALVEHADIQAATRIMLADIGVSLFFGLKDFARMEKNIERLEFFRQSDRTFIIRSRIELYRFQLDSARGRYFSGIAHYQRYKILTDSITNIKHDRQLEQLHLEYETEKKDQDIVLKAKHISLLTLETMHQKEQLHNEAIKKNFAYGVGALTLLLMCVSFWGYNVKRRSNEQLREQQFKINQQNITLKQLLDERDWLLKEVHHRVKNNLQIVISLLNSQALHLSNETAKQALRESKNRMQAVSIIHQKLYQSESFSGVDMTYYVGELLDFIQDSFSVRDKVEINADLDCAEMDVSQAVPVGLIINEAITNAIKHAAPFVRHLVIHVRLHCADNKVALTISDNGPGMPPNVDPLRCSTFGINLMVGLVRQLRGKINFVHSSGTTITMEFEQSQILA